ncbi:ETC complex I subunit [Mesorhizobium sp. M1066]|uniref:NADH dehydrogenase ubiquinone Fe-S protein 4 n=1 Tax=unclassified Mesorhizobium TaxID=325217 RepID=UPI00333595FF
METVQSSAIKNPTRTSGRPDNDNRPRLAEPALSMGWSVFPDGATARIYQPCRSAMTSAKPRKDWRLVFEPRTAPFIEPLMGYTGGRDTLTQVELNFPTLEAAIRYAERQGLNFVVQAAPPASQAKVRSQHVLEEKQAFSDVVWQRLQLAWLQASHGDGAGAQAAHIQTVLFEPETYYSSLMEVVDDPVLSPDETRCAQELRLERVGCIFRHAFGGGQVDQVLGRGQAVRPAPPPCAVPTRSFAAHVWSHPCRPFWISLFGPVTNAPD